MEHVEPRKWYRLTGAIAGQISLFSLALVLKPSSSSVQFWLVFSSMTFAPNIVFQIKNNETKINSMSDIESEKKVD